jgi:uroporphyrinogen-III synthase
MWLRLVLAYQLMVRIESKLLGSAWLGMRGEESRALTNHMAQEGALVDMVVAYTSDETSVGVLKLGEATEMP